MSNNLKASKRRVERIGLLGIVKAKNRPQSIAVGKPPYGGSFHLWAVGLLGVATCLADKTADRFESDTVHHMFATKKTSLIFIKKYDIIFIQKVKE